MGDIRKLYEEDSHCKTFEATVLDCEVVGEFFHIILDQTAFFPEGGGQVADAGVIADIEVLDVQEENNRIYHKTASPIAKGEKVNGKIDWDKRFSNMQQHSGEHIVSGLVNRLHGLDNIGFHMGSEAITMDFNGMLTMEELLKIEQLSNEAVVKNIKIKTYYPEKVELSTLEYRSKLSLQSGVRIVIIEGYDSCACCAPHVERTGEIGLIKILGVQKYKSGCRVSMLCGFRALADYNQKLSSVSAISVELSAKQDQITEAVKKCKEESYLLKGKISALNEKRIHRMITEQSEEEKFVCLIEDDLSANEMRKIVNAIVDKTGGTCAIFSPTGEEDKQLYILGSKTEDAKEVASYFNGRFSGKGGGSKEQVQGSLFANKNEILQTCKEHIASRK